MLGSRPIPVNWLVGQGPRFAFAGATREMGGWLTFGFSKFTTTEGAPSLRFFARMGTPDWTVGLRGSEIVIPCCPPFRKERERMGHPRSERCPRRSNTAKGGPPAKGGHHGPDSRFFAHSQRFPCYATPHPWPTVVNGAAESRDAGGERLLMLAAGMPRLRKARSLGQPISRSFRAGAKLGQPPLALPHPGSNPGRG